MTTLYLDNVSLTRQGLIWISFNFQRLWKSWYWLMWPCHNQIIWHMSHPYLYQICAFRRVLFHNLLRSYWWRYNLSFCGGRVSKTNSLHWLMSINTSASPPLDPRSKYVTPMDTDIIHHSTIQTVHKTRISLKIKHIFVFHDIKHNAK